MTKDQQLIALQRQVVATQAALVWVMQNARVRVEGSEAPGGFSLWHAPQEHVGVLQAMHQKAFPRRG